MFLFSKLPGPNLFAGTQGGVFISTNNGADWKSCYNDILNPTITGLVVYDTNVIVSTQDEGQGVYHSTDYGENWSAINAGLNSKWTTALGLCDSTIFVGIVFNGVWKRPIWGTEYSNNFAARV